MADRAKSQIAVLNHLSTIDEFIPVGALGEIVSNPLDVCRKLAEKGWVELMKNPVIPDLSGLSLNPIHKEVRFTHYQEQALGQFKASMDRNKFSPF